MLHLDQVPGVSAQHSPARPSPAIARRAGEISTQHGDAHVVSGVAARVPRIVSRAEFLLGWENQARLALN